MGEPQRNWSTHVKQENLIRKNEFCADQLRKKPFGNLHYFTKTGSSVPRKGADCWLAGSVDAYEQCVHFEKTIKSELKYGI